MQIWLKTNNLYSNEDTCFAIALQPKQG